MKLYLLCFGIVSLFSFCHSDNNKSVGFIDDNNQIILGDTIALKKQVINDLSKNSKDLKIDKVEIKGIVTVGEKAEKVYFIQFTDFKGKRQIAKYLFLEDKQFYLYNDFPKKESYLEEEAFYLSYFVCYGSMGPECFPNIGILNNELTWGAGTKLVCEVNSPCKTAQILVME